MDATRERRHDGTTAAGTPWRRAALALAGTLAVAGGGCASMPSIDGLVGGLTSPDASIAGARWSELTPESATLLFDVDVQNPYGAALPLAGLDYRLSSGGRRILAGEAEVTGSIPARSARTIEVPARIDFADALAALRTVRPGEVVPWEAELELGVEAPGIGPIRLPLRSTGLMPVPAIPDVRIESIRWDELTPARASARLDLAVSNPNEFALDLERFEYRLALAGTPVASAGLDGGSAIRARGSGRLSLPIEFSPGRLGGAVLGLLAGDGAGYEIEGTMQVVTPFGPMALPVAHAGRAPFAR